MALTHEQTRQNVHTLSALTAVIDWNKAEAAVDWEQVLQLQSELLRGSLERSAQQRYLEVTQAVVVAVASAARQ